MAVTKQQKILMGLVGVAALALAADRLVVGYDVTGPSSASADVIGASAAEFAMPAPTVQASVTGAASDAPVPAVSRNVLAERLASLGEAQSFALPDLVDAFEPSQSWLPAASVPESQLPQPTTARQALSERFQQEHHLEAVLAGDSQAFAVVDGQRVTPGQPLSDGAVLMHVGERSATFNVQGRQVELTLAGPRGR